MPHVELKTEQTYQREAPCKQCQYFERMIALAYRLHDEEGEAEARQEYQRHKALKHDGPQ